MITVVIATHNRAHLLPLAVESVLKQSCQEFEVLIVDDGSTDSTPAVIAAFSDPRIRSARNEQPLGASGARNRGAELATTPFISFLDDDDVYYPRKLEKTMAAFASAPSAGVVVSGFSVGGQSVIFDLNGDVAQKLTRRFYTLQPAILAVQRKLFLEAGGFDETLSTSEDLDFCLRISQICPFASLDSVQVQINDTPGRLSADVQVNERNTRLVVSRHFGRTDGSLRRPGRTLLNSYLGQTVFAEAKVALAGGRVADARQQMCRAIRFEPKNWKRWVWLIAMHVFPNFAARRAGQGKRNIRF